jgi:hypothetical protein
VTDSTEAASEVAMVFESDEFASAIEAYRAAIPDPMGFLSARGIVLPHGAELSVRVTPGSQSVADAKPESHQTCWEICVGPPFAKVCRTKCTTTK